MTPVGYAKLLAEFKLVREVLRPQVVRDIEEARAHGDISENSEFEDAKERQAHLDGRMRDIEARLSMADVIDITKFPPSERVIFGTTVDLEDTDTGESTTYKFVGTEEMDVKAGLISYSSPIGRALIGRSVGDEVRFETPKGTRTVVINAVHYR
ncbi:MAG: transcription elongation factor GreA [Pseudomonadota bacterium]|nr:transcription elongation factor GreA [Pseudomonadota bacterium]